MKKEIFEETENEKLVLDIPKEERQLNTSSYDYSVSFIVSMINSGKIVLEVPFQRKYVWKEDKASQLIESIVMNVPIPPIYFAEEENGKWLVVDGLQRLISLKTYFENEYGLKKLDILKDLGSFKYKDLPPKAKDLLDNGQLRANVIRKDSHPDIKYDIFMRLNKGAVTLNYQELRNCLYRGALNDVAKKLTLENHQFLNILGLQKPHNRFLDVEQIIRFFAFLNDLKKAENGEYFIDNYSGRLVTYINNFMSQNRELSEEKQSEMINMFNNTIDKTVEVFGIDGSFRDLTLEKSKANKAIADIILLSFTKFDKDILVTNKQIIIDALKSLLTEDSDFRSAISVRTSDKDALNTRISKWFKSLQNALHV